MPSIRVTRTIRTTLLTLGAAALVAGLVAILEPGSTAAAQTPAVPAFIEPGRCYRIAFPIDGALHYKVLERLDHGWIAAEVDAGSGKSQRAPLWINTAQIITMRDVRCSE